MSEIRPSTTAITANTIQELERLYRRKHTVQRARLSLYTSPPPRAQDRPPNCPQRPVNSGKYTSPYNYCEKGRIEPNTSEAQSEQFLCCSPTMWRRYAVAQIEHVLHLPIPYFSPNSGGDTRGDTDGDAASPSTSREFGEITQLVQPVLPNVPCILRPDFRALFFNSSIAPTTRPSNTSSATTLPKAQLGRPLVHPSL